MQAMDEIMLSPHSKWYLFGFEAFQIGNLWLQFIDDNIR